MKGFDVLIVGAGIIGCAAARECARAGLRVGVVDDGVVGGATTAAGMGHVVVMDDSPAQLALTAYSRQLWRDAISTLPSTVEYESCGTLWVAADEEEMAEVHAKRKTYADAGIASSILDALQLAAAEPNLRPGLAGALLVSDDGVVYPPAAARFYLDEAEAAGAVFIRRRATAAAQGTLQLSSGERLHAERIVLAAGSDCSLLPNLPVQKRKGHLVITDRYPGFVRHQLVELGYLKSAHSITSDSVAFNVQPRRTGQLLIGSSRQYGSNSVDVEPAILQQMLARAALYMPGLANLSALRVWTGFRAATADKLPLIGPALGLSNDPSLWLACGFEGLGITNAPGAARLLADALTGRDSAIDRTPYLPARLQTQAEPLHA